jgi:hypothetical protein
MARRGRIHSMNRTRKRREKRFQGELRVTNRTLMEQGLRPMSMKEFKRRRKPNGE